MSAEQRIFVHFSFFSDHHGFGLSDLFGEDTTDP